MSGPPIGHFIGKSHIARGVHYGGKVKDLTKNIKDVGLLQPLVVDQKNRVVSGNRRLEAIRALAMKTVQVEKVKVSDKDVGKLLVHHNKQRVKTHRELLNEYHVLFEHYSIGQGKRTDLSTSANTGRSSTTRNLISDELGVTNSQIQRLVLIEKENEELIELIDKGILTINQAYLQVIREKKERESRSNRKGRKKNSSGDDFIFYQKSSDNMEEVDDESVQLVFTSPPYWNKRTYSNKKMFLGNEKTPEDYVDHLINHLADVDLTIV